MSKRQPKVSVIVAVYKAEAFLEQCINSVLHQTFSAFELILVNDGSPDKCPEICDEFARRHSNVKVIHQKNAGQTAARKAGLQQAKGDYVLLADSDDWLEPTMLEAMFENATTTKADIVTCNMYFHTNGHRQEVNQPIPKGTFNRQELQEKIYPIMLYSGRFFYFGVAAAMWNKLFKRSLLLPNIMHIDEQIKIGEDGVATYGAFLSAKRVSVISDHLYNYRNDNASITRTYTEEQFTNAQKLINALHEVNREKKAYDLASQIDYYYMYNVWSIFEEEFRFKTDRSFVTKYSYLSRISCNHDVVEAARRIDLTGMRWRHRRFIWLLAHQQTQLLIVTTATSVKIRLFIRALYKLIK